MNAKKKSLIKTLVAALFLLGTAGGTSAGVFDAWNYQMKVSFSGYNKPETLTNFPVLLVLSNNAGGMGFAYSNCVSSAGGDLRFASWDEATALNYEIEKWDTNGASYVWVQVPAISTSNDFICAYWGCNTNAPACTTNGAPWSDGFKGVWHFASGSGTNVLDSTSNSLHGITYKTGSAVTWTNGWTNGPLGSALYFDGVNSNYVSGMGAGIIPKGGTTTNYTVSVWFKRANNSGNREMLSQWNVSGQSFYFGFNADTVRFTDNAGGQSVGLSNDSLWHHLVGVSTTNNAYLYLDGTLKWARGSAFAYADGTGQMYFGRQGVYNAPNYGDWYYGALDEVQISYAARSTNWIWASWLNQASNAAFLTYQQPVTSVAVRADAPSAITTNSATVNGTVLHAGRAENPLVYVCWDDSDRGTNALSNWLNAKPIGTNWGVGQSFFTNLTGLIAGSNYAYRCYATNSTGQDWSDTAVMFTVPYGLVIRGSPANYGNPLPNGYGMSLFQPGTSVTNAVASPTNATSTLRRACTGWNSTLLSDGSPVSSGVSTQAVVLMTNNLALTWNWTNEWYLTLANSVGGTNETKAGWYTEGSQVSVTAFPTGSYHFIGWVGDVPAGAATNNPITVTLNQAQTLRSQFSTLFSNFTLIVAGSPAAYGLPAPLNYGTNTATMADGTWVTNSVASPTNASTVLRRTCVGWSLAYTNGTALTGGITTQAIFQLNASERLTWLWTNEYYLSVGTNAGGTATTSVSDWYTNGIQRVISATATGSYTFLQWMGNVPAGSETNNPLTLTMDVPRSVVPVFVDNAVNETKVWSGSNYWYSGTNWTPTGVPGPEDDVVIRTGAVVLTGPTTINSLVVSNAATLVFSNWNSRLSVAGDVTVRSNGTVTLPPAFTDVQSSNNVYFACANLTIEEGGVLNADYAGYQGGYNRSGYGPGSSTYDRGGAGHGGRGTTYSPGTWGGAVCGSTNAPVMSGSGGSGSSGGTGGKGGGAVRIEASGRVCVNGIISANAGYTNSVGNAGGGSGGSIYITCATFTGTNGVVRANGGTGQQAGGGGGRIAIMCTDDAAQAQLPRSIVNFSAMRGGGGAMSAELGTVYLSTDLLIPIATTNFNGRLRGLPAWTLNFSQLVLANSMILLPDDVAAVALTVTNDFILDGSTLDVDGYAASRTPMTLNVGGNLSLTNAAKLYVYAGVTNGLTGTNGGWLGVTGNVSIATNCILYPTCHATNGEAVRIVASNVTIDAGGSIFANSRGYATGYGPGKPAGTGRGGAGHGGPGGSAGVTEYGGPSYGNSNAPIEAGSGSNHRNGGGVVWINAAGTLRVNGTITAKGADGAHDNGAGAGGSIYLTCATIAGASSGSMNANGGSAALTSGGGGGGRIAVYFASDQMGTNNVTANGGVHATDSTRNGTNGTVVWAQVAGGTYNLVISGDPSRHGVSAPYDYGNNAVAQGGNVSLSVNTPADSADGGRYACVGWTLSNATSVVDSGTSNSASFLMSTNLFLTWRWTSEWYLASSANSNGVLQADRTGWYTNGTPVTLQANADSGYGFLQWSGANVPAGQHTINPLTVTMDRPRTIMAQFATTTPPAVRTWTGSGNWWSVTNWNPAGVPGRAESVAISSGTVTLRDPAAVAGIIVSNTGALRVESTGTLTVASSMVITGASAVVVVSNAMLTCSNGLTVAGGGKLYAWGGVTDNPTNPACIITAMGTLLVRSNSYVFPCSHATNGGSAFFRVGSLTVEQGGWVNADSNGFAGAYGPGVGGGRGGGGYGGLGGDAVAGSELGGGIYGWSNAPVQPGSGSGLSYASVSRPGGGVIWVQAERVVTVDGRVTANGSAAAHDYGAGAGGSIYIRCSRFAGTGFCEARGGDTSGTSGGGGGGRVAVYRAFHTFTGTLSLNSVRGGTNATYYPARGGQYGTLVLGLTPVQGAIYTFR